jgi:osmotically-inducible protein OsmY
MPFSIGAGNLHLCGRAGVEQSGTLAISHENWQQTFAAAPGNLTATVHPELWILRHELRAIIVAGTRCDTRWNELFSGASLHNPTYEGTSMNRIKMTAIAAAITFAFSTGAMAASGMSKVEYKADKSKIAAEYKSAKAACSSMDGNAKDICVVEAKGKEKVAKAELEARYKPGDKTSHAVKIANAEADYAVAKEKCDDKAGNDKKTCVKDAKAAEARAKADAKKPAPAAEKPAAPVSKKESAGEYVDDAAITAKVKAAVLGDASLKATEINVETYKGVVQLTGFVKSRTDIDKAVQVAKGVKGVTSVKNDMIVKGQQ